jgi:hypothetical protein
MSSRLKLAGGTLSVLVLAYAVLISGEIFLGVITAGFVAGTTWIATTYAPEHGYLADLGGGLVAALVLVGGGVLAYYTVIANQLLVGILLASLVALVGVVAAPGGPRAAAGGTAR